MKYTVTFDEREFKSLIALVKNDFESLLQDQDDDTYDDMQDDIDILRAVSKAFKDENARLLLEAVIAGYESKLRYVR